MIVLFSLTLSLGMLVDNAIVIIENIFRYMEQGVPRIQAAIRASEVAQAVTASTLTTVAAFFPLLFWPGIMGEWMGYLPKAVIITLSSSLFVAMVINPALAAIFLRLPSGKKSTLVQASVEEVERASEAPITVRGPLLKGYRRLLNAALNHRLAVLIMAFLSVIALFMIWLYEIGIEKPIEFFPTIDPHAIFINLDTPEGANLEYSDRIARQVEMAVCKGPGSLLASPDADPAQCYDTNAKKKMNTLRQGQQVLALTDMENVKHIYSRTVAVIGGSSVFESNSPNHIGIQFYDIEDRVEPSTKTVEEIRKRVKDIPGAQISVAEQEEGPPTGAPINIEIVGDNFNVLGTIALQLRSVLEKIPFVQDIRDDYVPGSPTVNVRVDRQKASMLGLSTDIIGFALKVAFNGLKVSTFREGDEDYDITVQLAESDRKVTDILRELLIPTPEGLVPLSTVTTFEIAGGLGQVNRINHERVVTVKANVDEEKIPGPVVRAQAEKLLADFQLPPGYKIRFTGEFEFQQEAQAFLSKAFAAAVFLIILILVTQFNSVAQPLIIITSVILSLGGVFFGLSVMKLPFGIIMTGVGVISLAGVVVNNAIVLIDYTNRLHERGMQFREAIIAAGCTRLRPVLLTAITTILGLLPMVTGVAYNFHEMKIAWVSESSQWWQSMASAVIFGLALATVLTLVVVPTIYALVYTTSRKMSRGVKRMRKAYWQPFYRITGTTPEDQDDSLEC